MIKLVVLHPRPKDPEHFRKHYEAVHVPIVAKMPGLVSSKHSFDVQAFWPGEEQPVFCVAEIVFPDKETMHKAYQSDVGKQVMADVPNFATGGRAQVLVYELSEHP